MWLVDFILHIGDHLQELVKNYGNWIYAILFAIVFCETGLVVLPFLPGDSMLFAAGTIAAVGDMNIFVLIGLLIVAAVFVGGIGRIVVSILFADALRCV